MEESLDLLAIIHKEFNCEPAEMDTYSPLTLAYIGDSVFDIIIKTLIVEQGNRSAEGLHKKVTKLVNAGTQSAISDSLKEILTEEEADIFRRGRNAKSYTTAKNASVTDYRRATGLEALTGYLYLTGRLDRAVFLIREGLIRCDLWQEEEHE